MAIQLSITVGNIAATLSAGYTHIKVYRSPEETDFFTEIPGAYTLLPLQTGVSSYTYIDIAATTWHWYRTSFYDVNNSVLETVQSSSFRGTYLETGYATRSYPEEGFFSIDDRHIISQVREAIGDFKELRRDYVSAETGYSSISLDRFTHTLNNPKGWPLKVSLNSTEYTTLTEPVVNGYQYITFSGTQISTISGTVDIWYHNFRFSDRELLLSFNGLNKIPELGDVQIPLELSVICTAIEILEGELRLFGVTSGSRVDIFQEISIDPGRGISERLKDLDALRKKKSTLIAAILDAAGGLDANLFGVLID